jgi:OmpA-OmpF porin, OOP family
MSHFVLSPTFKNAVCKRFPVFFCLLLGISPLLHAQQSASVPNIVPNPGFERFAAPPIGWSYRGVFFGQVVKYWFSASSASPDVYGPGVQVPRDWAEKGFGEQKPRTGECMAGLTLYGCVNGKPHCREYIEIQLSEPLVPGQTYYVEFWATHLTKSLQINNLGAWFSETKIQKLTDEILLEDAAMKAEKIVEASEGKWIRVGGRYKATNEAEYLLIGNFSKDEDTQNKAWRDDCFNYAYYYIDDVLVRKIPPYLDVPIKADDITRIPLETGKTIQLKNIYFEFDKDELMPRSHVELNKLLKILRDNPKLEIAIVGHTDNFGEDGYNINLSRRRAESVVNFLLENKIAESRLQIRGEGEKVPVAPNDTDEGRQLNRRVEFVIVKK